VNAKLADLSGNIQQLKRGIAATAAIAYAPTPSAPGRTTFAINGSLFEDAGGVGFAFAHRLNTSMPVYLSGGYGNGGGHEHVGRVGFAWEW
jgi:hypothetical protein